MQDKNFDQLFKDQFEHAEIQPSSDLWDNISKELTPKKKKRSISIYWSAAAAVFVIVTIGLLYPKTEKMQLQAHLTTNVQLTDDHRVNDIPVKETTIIAEKSTPLVLAPKLKLINQVQENNLVAVQPKEANSRLTVKTADLLPTERVESGQKEIDLTNVTLAKVDIPEISETTEEVSGSTERKGIRNVGDVINYVVDKFDKREKKFIQFKTDDDDNSSLIAINIGILKFNPKRNR